MVNGKVVGFPMGCGATGEGGFGNGVVILGVPFAGDTNVDGGGDEG